MKDVESWIYNLTDANQNELQNPIWFRHFSLREAFNLKDLSPLTMNNFMNGESNDTKTQQVSGVECFNQVLMLILTFWKLPMWTPVVFKRAFY